MDRSEEALTLAEQTLEMLEVSGTALTPVVMRCLRIARLLENNTAELWMRLELRGYGPGGPGEGVSWARYADWSGRRSGKAEGGNFTYWIAPIEQIESASQLARDDISAYHLPQIQFTQAVASEQSTSGSNPWFPRSAPRTASENFLNNIVKLRSGASVRFTTNNTILSTLRGSLHDWLVGEVTRLKYGQVIENAFLRVKFRFDQFLIAQAPDVARALSGAYSRAHSNDPEDWSQSITSCRRALKALADAIYPATDNKIGNVTLNDSAYRNRIIQYVKDQSTSSSRARLMTADFDAFCERLEALDGLANKGVHASVERIDVDLAVVHTYQFAGEILSLTGQPPISAPAPLDVESQAADLGSESSEPVETNPKQDDLRAESPPDHVSNVDSSPG